MPLILAPSFDEHSREEIEAHLEEVRARRMVAAIEYATGVNAKLEYEALKVQKKMSAQYEMLAKEIAALDKALEKMEKRLLTLITLQQELGLTQNMITTIGATA